MQKHRTVMLVILDGWGWREDPTDNAVRQAHTPTFDELWRSCPHAFLRTSGRGVALPPDALEIRARLAPGAPLWHGVVVCASPARP